MVLDTDAGGVRAVGPVEDDLLVWRTRLAEHRVVVAMVQISPDRGQARGNVVVLQLGRCYNYYKYHGVYCLPSEQQRQL